MKRVYVTEEADKRVRKYAAERGGIDISQAYHHVICLFIDESGKLQSPLGEAQKEIEELATRIGFTIPETISLLARTVKTLYSDKLPFYKALKGLRELEKEVEAE